MPIVFITGTDTGCGKTHTTAALLHALNRSGRSAVGFKPIASGCERTAEGLRNEDALILQRYSAPGFTYQQINPIALEPAIAPHLAAADAGVKIELTDILAGAYALAEQAEWVLVEGAGGFLVPLNDQHSFANLIELSQWPCLLVVGMRLGCINHALLSARVIAGQGALLGWVANVLPPQQERWRDNIASLDSRIAQPCLGALHEGSIEEAADQLNLKAVIEQFA